VGEQHKDGSFMSRPELPKSDDIKRDEPRETLANNTDQKPEEEHDSDSPARKESSVSNPTQMTEEEYRRHTVELTSDMAHVLNAVQEMVAGQFKEYSKKFAALDQTLINLNTKISVLGESVNQVRMAVEDAKQDGTQVRADLSTLENQVENIKAEIEAEKRKDKKDVRFASLS